MRSRFRPGEHPNSRAARQHNGLRGSVAMAKLAMIQITQSPTTSDAAKAKASRLWTDLDSLGQELSANRNNLP